MPSSGASDRGDARRAVGDRRVLRALERSRRAAGSPRSRTARPTSPAATPLASVISPRLPSRLIGLSRASRASSAIAAPRRPWTYTRRPPNTASATMTQGREERHPTARPRLRPDPPVGRRRGCAAARRPCADRSRAADAGPSCRRAGAVARRRTTGLLGAGARARDRCRHPPAPAGSGTPCTLPSDSRSQPVPLVGTMPSAAAAAASWVGDALASSCAREVLLVLVQPAQLVGQVVLVVRARGHRGVEEQRGQERSGEDGHAGKDERHPRPGVLRRADDTKPGRRRRGSPCVGRGRDGAG